MNTAADVAFVRIFNFLDDTAADTIMKRLTIQILLSLKWKKLGCIAIQYIYVYHAHLWIFYIATQATELSTKSRLFFLQ